MFTFDPQVKPEIRIKLANVVLEDFTSVKNSFKNFLKLFLGSRSYSYTFS